MTKELLDLLVRKVFKVLQVFVDSKVLQDHKEQLDQLVVKVFKEFKVFKELLDQRVRQVQRVLLVLRGKD